MLPVTATEVFVEFKRPPMETFGEIVPGTSVHLRIRISPDIAIGMGVRVKTPGERMTGRDVELLLNGAPTTCLPTSDWWATPCGGRVSSLPARTWWKRNGARSSPSWANVTPFYHDKPGTWGPDEADQLISSD